MRDDYVRCDRLGALSIHYRSSVGDLVGHSGTTFSLKEGDQGGTQILLEYIFDTKADRNVVRGIIKSTLVADIVGV